MPKTLPGDEPGSSVTYHHEDGAAWIRIGREDKYNALTGEMYLALFKCLARADCDDEVDTVVITGTGRAFCAGGDLKRVASLGTDVQSRLDLYLWAQTAHNVFSQAETMNKIVIAAVNGVAQAGGLILTLTSDLVVASDRATFRVPEARVGMGEPYVPLRLLPRVGSARAQDLIQTARQIDAHEALRIGLVSRVAAHDELEDVVRQEIAEIRKGAPEQRLAYKQYLVRQLPPFNVADLRRCAFHPVAREGTTAFAEGRPPAWMQSRAGNPAGQPMTSNV
jgi:enoyl-CoA hydratase/carnithine racemase